MNTPLIYFFVFALFKEKYIGLYLFQELCSCWVLSKRPETTTWKTSMMIGRWYCQVIWANWEKKNETENGMELHCGYQYGNHQTTRPIRKYIFMQFYFWFESFNAVVYEFFSRNTTLYLKLETAILSNYWGSISGWVIPKTQKMVHDAALLSTQHYKVRIKGKVEQSRKWSSALPYTLV